MVTLNPRQKMLLSNTRRANLAWRNAKAGALSRAKELVAAELREYEAAMDHEVRLAFEAGVSKRQLHTEGLGTSDSHAVVKSLQRTERVAKESRNGRLTAEPLSEHVEFDRSTRIVSVTSPSGETVKYNEHGGQMFTYSASDPARPWEQMPILPSAEFSEWFNANRAVLLERLREAVEDV